MPHLGYWIASWTPSHIIVSETIQKLSYTSLFSGADADIDAELRGPHHNAEDVDVNLQSSNLKAAGNDDKASGGKLRASGRVNAVVDCVKLCRRAKVNRIVTGLKRVYMVVAMLLSRNALPTVWCYSDNLMSLLAGQHIEVQPHAIGAPALTFAPGDGPSLLL